MAYFPMFVQLKKKKCLVIGGGKIALRKIEVLKDFEVKNEELKSIVTFFDKFVKMETDGESFGVKSFERLWRKILMRQIL